MEISSLGLLQNNGKYVCHHSSSHRSLTQTCMVILLASYQMHHRKYTNLTNTTKQQQLYTNNVQYKCSIMSVIIQNADRPTSICSIDYVEGYKAISRPYDYAYTQGRSLELSRNAPIINHIKLCIDNDLRQKCIYS